MTTSPTLSAPAFPSPPPVFRQGSLTVGFRASGSSPPRPSLHLVGLGKVGRAVLRELERAPFLLRAVSDSSGTAFAREGLDAARVEAVKRRGGSVTELPSARAIGLPLALDLVRADVVLEATPTLLDAACVKWNLYSRFLWGGGRVAFASKDALLAGADEILTEELRGRVGLRAALGGTGDGVVRRLELLRARCTDVAIVGNASTTAVVLGLEEGLGWEEALTRAVRLGLLEPNPEQDLDGTDAAVKLGIVARAVFGVAVDPRAVPRAHARTLDPALLRARRRRGATTRLVARFDRAAEPRVAFEEVRPPSLLCTGLDRVAYTFGFGPAAPRLVLLGDSVGPAGTAKALLADAAALTAGGAR